MLFNEIGTNKQFRDLKQALKDLGESKHTQIKLRINEVNWD